MEIGNFFVKHGDIKSVDSVCPTKNQHSEIQATPLLDTDVRLETQLIILASSICPRFTNANLRDIWAIFVGKHVRKYTVQSERPMQSWCFGYVSPCIPHDIHIVICLRYPHCSWHKPTPIPNVPSLPR